jgi:hypothetical protein
VLNRVCWPFFVNLVSFEGRFAQILAALAHDQSIDDTNLMIHHYSYARKSLLDRRDGHEATLDMRHTCLSFMFGSQEAANRWIVLLPIFHTIREVLS